MYGLPAELWLEIFSNLDYLSLLSVKATCRRFENFLFMPVSSPSRPRRIDLTLFRDKAVDGGQCNRPYNSVLHPLLEKRGFVLHDGECDRGPLSGSPPKLGCKCGCISPRVGRLFDDYDEMALFADKIHAVLAARNVASSLAYSQGHVYAENAVSPATTQHVKISMRFGSYKLTVNHEPHIDNIPSSATVGSFIRATSVGFHVFWARVVLSQYQPEDWLLCGYAILESYVRLKGQFDMEKESDLYKGGMKRLEGLLGQLGHNVEQS